MKNKITKTDINFILANTLIKVEKYGDKTTILKATLPNGFETVVSASSFSSEGFDMTTGEQLCMTYLENKIWELESYRLQSQLNKEDK